MTEANAVARWLKQCSVRGDYTPIREAYDAFKKWADNNDEKCGTDQWFGRRMAQLRHMSEPIKVESKIKRVYKGFVLSGVEAEQPSLEDIHGIQ